MAEHFCNKKKCDINNTKTIHFPKNKMTNIKMKAQPIHVYNYLSEIKHARTVPSLDILMSFTNGECFMPT